MPRLSSRLLRYAATRSPYLPRLLRECRDLESASNELRWLADHANTDTTHGATRVSTSTRLQQYVSRRSRGEPLQYILGTQPFGELDIVCRQNVLIPRPETELYTTTLAALLREACRARAIGEQQRQPFRIVDLCTGTGCIALLLHRLLRPPHLKIDQLPHLEILGADVSLHALQLAHHNLKHNIDSGALNVSCKNDISFHQLDVLSAGRLARRATHLVSDVDDPVISRLLDNKWDVIVSNPPYISPADYAPGGSVGRSVRDYEPKLALVPPPLPADTKHLAVTRADQFYEAILRITTVAQARVLVMEIGDAEQARRVRELARKIMPHAALIETWRDDGSVDAERSSSQLDVSSNGLTSARERAIVVWTGELARWRLKTKQIA